MEVTEPQAGWRDRGSESSREEVQTGRAGDFHSSFHSHDVRIVQSLCLLEFLNVSPKDVQSVCSSASRRLLSGVSFKFRQMTST